MDKKNLIKYWSIIEAAELFAIVTDEKVGFKILFKKNVPKGQLPS